VVFTRGGTSILERLWEDELPVQLGPSHRPGNCRSTSSGRDLAPRQIRTTGKARRSLSTSSDVPDAPLPQRVALAMSPRRANRFVFTPCWSPWPIFWAGTEGTGRGHYRCAARPGRATWPAPTLSFQEDRRMRLGDRWIRGGGRGAPDGLRRGVTAWRAGSRRLRARSVGRASASVACSAARCRSAARSSSRRSGGLRDRAAITVDLDTYLA
jgi:hypothetical protein